MINHKDHSIEKVPEGKYDIAYTAKEFSFSKMNTKDLQAKKEEEEHQVKLKFEAMIDSKCCNSNQKPHIRD